MGTTVVSGALTVVQGITSIFGGPTDFDKTLANLEAAIGQGNVLAYLVLKIIAGQASSAETAYVQAHYAEIQPLLVGNAATGPTMLRATTDSGRLTKARAAVTRYAALMEPLIGQLLSGALPTSFRPLGSVPPSNTGLIVIGVVVVVVVIALAMRARRGG